MVPVEDDRSLAGNVPDGSSDSIDEDALNDRYAGTVNDDLDVDGRPLTGKRQETSSSIPGKFVPDFPTL